MLIYYSRRPWLCQAKVLSNDVRAWKSGATFKCETSLKNALRASAPTALSASTRASATTGRACSPPSWPTPKSPGVFSPFTAQLQPTRCDDAAGRTGQPARRGELPAARCDAAGVAATGAGTDRCAARRGIGRCPPNAVQRAAARTGKQGRTRAHRQGLGTCKRWLMRTGTTPGQREYRLTTARAFTHVPTTLDHSTDSQNPGPNTLARFTTVRLATRRRSQRNTDTYPDWKRMKTQKSYSPGIA